jgi:hypothetical protein
MSKDKPESATRCKSLGPRNVQCVREAGHDGPHEVYFFTWESAEEFSEVQVTPDHPIHQ